VEMKKQRRYVDCIKQKVTSLSDVDCIKLKTRLEGDRAVALRGARRNADRRTPGATHASRVCFAQLPNCRVAAAREIRAWDGVATSCVDRVIAGMPTLQTPRRSQGTEGGGGCVFSAAQVNLRGKKTS
jgi:hypothetical protein